MVVTIASWCSRAAIFSLLPPQPLQAKTKKKLKAQRKALGLTGEWRRRETGSYYYYIPERKCADRPPVHMYTASPFTLTPHPPQSPGLPSASAWTTSPTPSPRPS